MDLHRIVQVTYPGSCRERTEFSGIVNGDKLGTREINPRQF